MMDNGLLILSNTFVPLVRIKICSQLEITFIVSVLDPECENGISMLTCPAPLTISVLDAFYGRDDMTTCPGRFGVGSPQLADDTCTSDATALYGAMCDGDPTCMVAVTNGNLGGDPCGGTYKFARVTYTCVP